MRKRGFTLVELLVVIAIIALLMGILMPALARVRQIAYRMICGTNLSNIGKAILIYAQDNGDRYPVAGGRGNAKWGKEINSWTGETVTDAFGAATETKDVTISSCFYYLVKYADITTKSFVCSGDTGASEFMLFDFTGLPTRLDDPVKAWDFGPYDETDASSVTSFPSMHCSYSYHYPFSSQYTLSTTSNPELAIAADRSPFIGMHNNTDPEASDIVFKAEVNGGSIEEQKRGNSTSHQRDGQNVLFNDMHADFASYSNCGLDDDNIYTYWEVPSNPTDIQREEGKLPHNGSGEVPAASNTYKPASKKDSFLVNEGTAQGTL